MKIGLAVTTTPNRKNVFQEWYNHYAKFCPELRLYIHNDIDYQGVGYSKNKCLNALYEAGCDYFFLFDDDCFIKHPGFFKFYIHSKLEHAAYTFNRKLISKGSIYNEYEDPNGCMLFFTRKCVEVAGGWSREFKGYGYEHSELSARIFNLGLTPARFIDIPDSSGLFEMADCESSFTARDRNQIPANYKLYQEKFYSKEFKPFK